MKKGFQKKAFLFVFSILILLFSMSFDSKAADNPTRNTTFTTLEQMQSKLGADKDSLTWSPVYLTEVENYYWTFCDQNELGQTDLSLNLAKNAYRNLEMLLDNGYTMDYQILKNYCAEYLAKTGGKEDAYYKVLTSCLDNPYLLNRPAASVTATTYNGRDYAPVFDAAYYYQNNPDLQQSIGNNPPELLRHFVEQGINQGRRGNASFDLKNEISIDGKSALILELK